MTKIKPLLPSLRERKRYIVFEVLSDKPLTFAKNISKSIENTLLRVFGEQGYARCGPIFLHNKYDPKKQQGIVRVAHTSVDEFITAMALTETVDTMPVAIRTRGVSGILAKAQSQFMSNIDGGR